MNTHSNSLGDCMPTVEVEVPCLRVQPSPDTGYGYHARAPLSTDIDDIAEEEWDIVVGAPPGDYQYMGQRTLDSTTVNVWFCGEDEGFFAQSLQGC
jgi:hypothetical protein